MVVDRKVIPTWGWGQESMTGLVATAQGSSSELLKQLLNAKKAGRAYTFPLY
jgi:hypothetical protein